jgi:uncharacterized RDD family membrane protein YckC
VADHDSPISLSPSGGSLARVIVAEQNADHWKIPEGTILASATRRGTAFAIDVVIVTTVLMLVTRFQLMNVWNLKTWEDSTHHSLAYTFILLASHWLYWRLTGIRFSRSLGQRSMGLAVLVDDGSEMTSEMWDRRAFRKLVYLIPVVNLIVGSYEVARIFQRHTHQTNIDLSVGSIVAQADSLPPANRRHIR